ncbi:NagC family transcriptional regulator [Bifidobacterium margollesii]|uniref:Glucokinase n=2 Tax=Bifidobacterium margollesii TaxID=2020964 RepID=A0A2N5J8G5_9BIFI|nr:ROK family glucokinase [Bifidobacterium margollesii]PLS30481.1 NagC family transcriptional regulator [Bifidobacterium margollesii]
MYTLGIDIGGTKIAGAICDDDNKIISQWREPTPEDPEDINAVIVEMYRKSVELYGAVPRMGISAAGNVKEDRRTVTFSANIAQWIDYPLAERIEELTDHECKVIVENDANCAGWGEYILGTGRGSKNMVMLTVGTGLGGAIVINGQLYRGSFGMAAELGHLPMVSDGDFCGCGLRGCAERYTSGNALEHFAKSAVRRMPQKSKRLMELCDGDVNNLEGKMVSQAAQEGDELGLYAFGKIGEWLGRTMAAIAAVLDPDLFVIGGGVVSVGDILLEPARYNYVRFLQAAAYREHAKVLAATAGGDAGMIGAADLARIEED